MGVPDPDPDDPLPDPLPVFGLELPGVGSPGATPERGTAVFGIGVVVTPVLDVPVNPGRLRRGTDSSVPNSLLLNIAMMPHYLGIAVFAGTCGVPGIGKP